MLLSGSNGTGKSTLVGRWVRQLENRIYTPVNLTQAHGFVKTSRNVLRVNWIEDFAGHSEPLLPVSAA
jgi:GTPase SAR1 family protein